MLLQYSPSTNIYRMQTAGPHHPPPPLPPGTKDRTAEEDTHLSWSHTQPPPFETLLYSPGNPSILPLKGKPQMSIPGS